MAYQKIPVTGTVDAAIVNRIQDQVAEEFATLESSNSLVTPIVGTKRIKSYTVQSADRYITVDASAIDVAIVLPPPGNQQVVTVARVAGNVSVVQGSGAKFADGSAGIPVTTSAQFLNDGKTWLVLS